MPEPILRPIHVGEARRAARVRFLLDESADIEEAPLYDREDNDNMPAHDPDTCEECRRAVTRTDALRNGEETVDILRARLFDDVPTTTRMPGPIPVPRPRIRWRYEVGATSRPQTFPDQFSPWIANVVMPCMNIAEPEQPRDERTVSIHTVQNGRLRGQRILRINDAIGQWSGFGTLNTDGRVYVWSSREDLRNSHLHRTLNDGLHQAYRGSDSRHADSRQSSPALTSLLNLWWEHSPNLSMSFRCIGCNITVRAGAAICPDCFPRLTPAQQERELEVMYRSLRMQYPAATAITVGPDRWIMSEIDGTRVR